MAVVNMMKEKSANQMNDVKIEVQPLTVEEVKTKIWEAEQLELKNMKQPGFIPCTDIAKLQQGVRHDKRVEEVKQNLTVYGVYLTILLILVYGQCDSNSYLVQKTMTTNVVSPFQKVSNISSYWKWVKSTLLPNLFPENIYERLKISPTKQTFLKDLNSHRFGSIRFRQKRQKQVKINCGSQPLEPTCVHLAMELTEDKTRYYEGWQQNPGLDNLKEQKTVWDYQETEAPMPGFFAMGQTTSFGSGGYIAHLEGNLSRANDMVNYLINNSWCDAKTSAIFTEFVVYNPNVNLFCYTTMLVERFAGVFMPSHEIFVYRVQQNNQIMNTVLHVAYVGYIIVIACLIILMVIQARQLGTKIFFRLASWSEFLSLSLGLSAIVVFYLKTNAGYELSALKMAGPWKAKTLNFIGLNLLSSHILAALVFLIFLKIYEIFGASQWLRPMFRSMQLTAELLKPFSIIFCVILLAYALLFWAVFGSYLRLYGSLILSMTSVISALLGKSDFKQLFMLGGDLAAFLYLVFMFSFAILLFDVGILLVSEATSAAFSEDDESAVPFSIFASPLLKTYKALCELKRKKKKKHSSEKK